MKWVTTWAVGPIRMTYIQSPQSAVEKRCSAAKGADDGKMMTYDSRVHVIDATTVS